MAPSPAIPRTSSRPPELSAFGRRVRKARKTRGFSQAQLGRRMKVPASSINRVEHGQSSPSLMMIHNYAQGLGVPPAWLLEPSGPVPDAPEREHPWRNRWPER